MTINYDFHDDYDGPERPKGAPSMTYYPMERKAADANSPNPAPVAST